MKTQLILLKKTAIAALFILSGCTRTLYTHDQVMSRYQTKDQIAAKFGLPSEKRTGGNLEEWVYNYGTVGSGSFVAYRGVGVSNYSSYQKFIKFTFDNNGVLLKWDTQGVNLAEKKVSAGKTIIGVVFGLGLCIALGAALGNSGQTL